jgi:hypothetical protein
MADAIIQFTLRGGQDEGGLMLYQPGQRVRGTVQLIPDSGDLNCKHIFVRLQWHTEGRGDRDQQCIAQLDVFQGTLQARIPTTYDFAFMLPREPWSYAGHYVNIVWEIEVEVDVPWAVNLRRSQPFVMALRDDL